MAKFPLLYSKYHWHSGDNETKKELGYSNSAADAKLCVNDLAISKLQVFTRHLPCRRRLCGWNNALTNGMWLVMRCRNPYAPWFVLEKSLYFRRALSTLTFSSTAIDFWAWINDYIPLLNVGVIWCIRRGQWRIHQFKTVLAHSDITHHTTGTIRYSSSIKKKCLFYLDSQLTDIPVRLDI